MKIMSFLWRRRLSVVKIVILLSAVWFTVEFLIYSDDIRTSNIVASGPHALELKYNNEFDDGGDNPNSLGGININDIFNDKNDSVVNNVISSNLNNNDNFNSIRNANDDSGKHHKISAQHKYDAKQPAFDDNGKLWIFDLFTSLSLEHFRALDI